jgi:hypothetical protein
MLKKSDHEPLNPSSVGSDLMLPPAATLRPQQCHRSCASSSASTKRCPSRYVARDGPQHLLVGSRRLNEVPGLRCSMKINHRPVCLCASSITLLPTSLSSQDAVEVVAGPVIGRALEDEIGAHAGFAQERTALMRNDPPSGSEVGMTGGIASLNARLS